MAFLLCILAVGMIALGLTAIVFGMSIVQVERGWTMVISGTVGASGGAILLGLALAAQRLGRIATEIVWIRDRLATIGEMTAEAATWSPVVGPTAEPDVSASLQPVEQSAADGNLGVDELLRPAYDPTPPPAPPQERRIVGQYASGGNEYKMYSDSSIDAMTPAGLRRFTSLEELRKFVAGGGEQAG